MGGWVNYTCCLYVEDAIFVESALANRPAERLAVWKEIAKQVLGDDCVNQGKAELEGERPAELSFLCFCLDTFRMTIIVADVEIDSAALFVLSAEFESPFHRLNIMSLQILRGLMTHWLNAAIFWRSCVQPVDAILSFPDANGEYATCPDPELLTAFWQMMTLLKSFARGPPTWAACFREGSKRSAAYTYALPTPLIVGQLYG